MKHTSLFYSIIVTLALSACGGPSEPEQDEKFGEVKPLKQFPTTQFLATLETPIDAKSNGVYAASLVYAWKEIEKTIGSEITNIESAELRRLYECRSFRNVLNKDEYSTEVTVDKRKIKAKAFFSKSLPLKEPLTLFDKSLQINGTNVTCFGFYGYHIAAEIEYYNSDNDFAIKLHPKDGTHEIILCKKPFQDKIVLGKEVEKFHQHVAEFKAALSDKNRWRYYFSNEDETNIPVINFNLETNYKSIEQTTFLARGNEWSVIEAYQRTAFLLNEKGAEVESEAEVEVEEASEEEEEPQEKPKPKKLIFDKPFIIMLKRVDNSNPYFAAYIANAELLVKK